MINMNEKLYKLILEDKVVLVVDDFAFNSNNNYKRICSYINTLEDKNIFNFNRYNRVVSIPNKKGKIYFNTVSSLEKIRSVRADDFIYNGSDDRVISFLKSRIINRCTMTMLDAE